MEGVVGAKQGKYQKHITNLTMSTYKPLSK